MAGLRKAEAEPCEHGESGGKQGGKLGSCYEMNIFSERWDTNRIHIGIEWLESVHFGHVSSIGERVLIIGVGNTAMDCCRSAKRLGATDVKVIARKTRKYFKASPWELEDAEEEQVEILENLSPVRFIIGMVSQPSTITFATAEPEIVPNRLELTTDTLPGPPAVWPVRLRAKSMKSWPVPVRSMNVPNSTKIITYDAETARDWPKMPSVDR